MEDKFRLLAGELGDSRLKREIDLAEYIHNGRKVIAEAFYLVTSQRELVKTVQLCRELGIDFLIIGTGSKTMFTGSYVRGLVIKNRSDAIRIFGIKGKVSRGGLGVEEASLEIDSGTSLERLASFSIQQKLGGLEILAKRPGTVGGSITTVSELQEKATQVNVLTIQGNRDSKTVRELDKGDVIISVVVTLKAIGHK